MLKRIFAVAAVLAACVSLAGTARAELVFYVPIDGNSADDIAGGNAGAVQGAFFTNDTPAALGAGQSLDFANFDQVVDYGNLPLLEGKEASTVSMWIKPFEILLLEDGGDPPPPRRHLALSKDGVLEYGLRGGELTNRVNNADHGLSDGLALDTPDTWYHVASVFDASGDGGMGTTQHYLNGVPFGDPVLLMGNPDAGMNEGGLVFVSNDNPVILGNRDPGDDEKNFDGLLDDIAVWDTALGAEAIAALASGAVSPPDAEEVPEPSTLALVVLGLIGLLGTARRRRNT